MTLQESFESQDVQGEDKLKCLAIVYAILGNGAGAARL